MAETPRTDTAPTEPDARLPYVTPELQRHEDWELVTGTPASPRVAP